MKSTWAQATATEPIPRRAAEVLVCRDGFGMKFARDSAADPIARPPVRVGAGDSAFLPARGGQGRAAGTVGRSSVAFRGSCWHSWDGQT